jgi:hypothetical protein
VYWNQAEPLPNLLIPDITGFASLVLLYRPGAKVVFDADTPRRSISFAQVQLRYAIDVSARF